MEALALLAESANRIKVWQIEIERSIDLEIDRAAKSAQGIAGETPNVPKAEIVAAARVEILVGKLAESQSGSSVLKSVRVRMVSLGDQYDKVREEMVRGRERTVAMNAIVAQMRTLAKAASAGLKDFSEFKNSAGIRLCAIAILQMTPKIDYLDWLGERFSVEEQPFVLYQTAVALWEAAQGFGSEHREKLCAVSTAALRRLREFQGGEPDRNSIKVLEDTLQLLHCGTKVADQ